MTGEVIYLRRNGRESLLRTVDEQISEFDEILAFAQPKLHDPRQVFRGRRSQIIVPKAEGPFSGTQGQICGTDEALVLFLSVDSMIFRMASVPPDKRLGLRP